MTSQSSITLEIRDAIAVVRINLPDAHPSGSLTPAYQLKDLCQSIDEDPAIRVIILTNTPPALWYEDPVPLSDNPPSDDPEPALQPHRVASQVAALKVPTIAAIQGRAWNQALELALACDLRIAADNSTFGFSSLAEGFIPWDGATQRLPRIIGRALATDLLLTGRPLTAAEALKIGLLNSLTPSEDLHNAALNLALSIAEAAPIATRFIKEAVLKGLDMPLPQGLNLEADLSFILQTTQDRQRGIQSFFTKTPPKFTGQ